MERRRGDLPALFVWGSSFGRNALGARPVGGFEFQFPLIPASFGKLRMRAGIWRGFPDSGTPAFAGGERGYIGDVLGGVSVCLSPLRPLRVHLPRCAGEDISVWG